MHLVVHLLPYGSQTSVLRSLMHCTVQQPHMHTLKYMRPACSPAQPTRQAAQNFPCKIEIKLCAPGTLYIDMRWYRHMSAQLKALLASYSSMVVLKFVPELITFQKLSGKLK